MLKKKIWASFQRIIELITQKFVTKLALKNMGLGSGIRDPGSGKKTYSGSRIRVHGSKRHRIPDPDPQHCYMAKHLVTDTTRYHIYKRYMMIKKQTCGF
jgi:hypothetical protein